METKHTQGEWILNESKSEIVSSNECSKNGGIDIIAQCYVGFNYESTINECKANAKLIASAPELLKALIKIKKDMDIDPYESFDDYDKKIYTQIVNAINKATK